MIRQLFAQVETALLGSVLLDNNDIHTWHLRLGHRNVDDLRTAIKKNLIAGVPTAAAKKNKQKSRSLCDACVRAKSHRHPRRLKRKNKKTSLPQSDLQHSVPALTENSDEDSDEYDESAIFRGFNRTDVPVGRPRDIAQAQPVINTISMLFTDVKGPLTPAGTKGEVYAQSFIEGDTKF